MMVEKRREPKWQQEIEEILLKDDEKAKHTNLLRAWEIDSSKVTKDTLRELRRLWGDCFVELQPKDYRKSHHLIRNHRRRWEHSCIRVLRRTERLQRMLDIDAPQIIIQNEKRLLAEALAYLAYNSLTISFNLLANQYRPRGRHRRQYKQWLKSKLKLNGATPEESVSFFTSIGLSGRISIIKDDTQVKLLLGWGKEKGPKGWKGKAQVFARGK